MKIFGREPAAVIAAVGSIITVLAAMSLSWLNAGQAAALTGAIAAVILVLTTRPIAPGLVTGVVTAGAALLAEYGLHASDALVGALTAATLAVFALLTRQQVEPKETAVTRS